MSDERELSKAYDPTEVEGCWYPFWMDKGLFRADAQSTKPPFSIVLPPPNVTGSLHLGHALTATIQDILSRWKRMSGFNVLWLPGTDHAGIATQMVVEKELKKAEGKSRHDLGREEFLKRVWAWKEKYGARIGEQHKVLGASMDWSRERFTMDAGLSKAVREVFVRLYEEGLIYRAQKLINWCPSCRTALSDLEVEHEEKDGSLWHIKYPVKGQERFLTVATTRPETMLGDTAVAIHPDDPRYQGLAGGTVILPLVNREIPIIADAELVAMEFGTGVVKVTPAHDFNDYQTGLRHKLPMISILDEAARTNEAAGAYAGLDRYEARTRVVAELEAQGLLEKIEPHKLSVGTCQRCATVVEPLLSPQWFVKIDPLAKPAIEAVEQGRTRFYPETWTQTYFSWMKNIHDWCISRQLWWGHQIPAYYCTACSPRTTTGSLDYARARPIVAREKPAACPDCGSSALEQDADVLDTWFSSGLWPFSTLGWPEQTADLRTWYPTSVMETGHDIIFFWVARMMMMGLHFMKDVPFRVVYLHAMVRDEKGEKMSKTKGNVVDPLDVIRGAPAKDLAPSLRNKFPQGMPAFGADALRFTLASLTQQGRDIKLSLDRVSGYKAFTNKVWNAARFALMNLGDFHLGPGFIKDRDLSLADRWMLSRLEKAIAGTHKALEAFEFSDAASTLYQFLWREFCDWYIELSKGALYGTDEKAKETTRAVLVFSLDQILRLLHPFMPFITEEIWQKLPMERPTESIVTAPFPKADGRLVDEAAEAEMEPVISAIEGLRNIRGESNLPPTTKLVAEIQSASEPVRAALEKWRHYLMPLAGLSEVRIRPPGEKPKLAVANVHPQMEIFVPLAGLLDLAAERDRLRKEIAKSEQELASIAKKLENPSFVARAPAEVVEKDRARVEELKGRQLKLQDNLSRLSEEATPAAAPAKPPRLKLAKPVADEPGGMDLGAELKQELSEVSVPQQVDPQVTHALEKLRETTKEGLTPADHYDLGVAYMGMGLVDDAVREFNEARKSGESPEEAEEMAAQFSEEAKAKAKKPKAGKKAKVSTQGALPLDDARTGAALLKPVKAKKPASSEVPEASPAKAQARKAAAPKAAPPVAAAPVKAVTPGGPAKKAAIVRAAPSLPTPLPLIIARMSARPALVTSAPVKKAPVKVENAPARSGSKAPGKSIAKAPAKSGAKAPVKGSAKAPAKASKPAPKPIAKVKPVARAAPPRKPGKLGMATAKVKAKAQQAKEAVASAARKIAGKAKATAVQAKAKSTARTTAKPKRRK